MEKFVPRFSRRVDNLKPSATVALTDKAKQLKAEGRDIVTMSAGEPDFATPSLISEAAIAALKEGDTHYAPSPGVLSLREALVEKLRTRNGIPLAGPQEVLVVPGAKAGLMFACLALLDDGDECVCPEPAWVSYRECVSFAGANYIPVPSSGADGFSIDPHLLDHAVTDRTRLIILNSPTNPTGKVWRREELEAVADVVRSRDIVVLSDEIYEDLVFDGAEHISFASLPGMAEKTLTLNGFSKAYAMTGWRLGYLAGPAPIIKSMLKIQQHSTTCAASFVQTAGVVALEQGAADVQSMVSAFERRRKLLVDGLSEIEGVVARPPDGTFYLFLDISALGKSSVDVAESMLESVGLAATPGSAFGASGEGYLRVSFAASDEHIKATCERIARFARERLGDRS